MYPFTQNAGERIDSIGENNLLGRIQQWLGSVNPSCPRGIGDDAAVLPPPRGKHILLTNDSLVWGRHFDETATPEQAGAKLLKRNLSDIAAMGGKPLHAVLAITCGPDLSISWLSQFFQGLSETAQTFGCEINGGDIAESNPEAFVATLSLIGESDQPAPRLGGKAESWIWTTGSLGGSILGHHLNFTPRLPEGQWLARRPETLAMMDITDGLARDLPKMVPDGLQARIDLSLVPVSDEARATAQDTGKPPVWHAFTDGEDYELLFITAPGIDATGFEAAWKKTFRVPLAAIGSLRPRSEDSIGKIAGLDGGKLFDGEGFEHFRLQG